MEPFGELNGCNVHASRPIWSVSVWNGRRPERMVSEIEREGEGEREQAKADGRPAGTREYASGANEVPNVVQASDVAYCSREYSVRFIVFAFSIIDFHRISKGGIILPSCISCLFVTGARALALF